MNCACHNASQLIQHHAKRLTGTIAAEATPTGVLMTESSSRPYGTLRHCTKTKA